MEKHVTDRPGTDDPSALRPILISIAQLQALLSCGRTKAYQLVKDGSIRSVLIGRSRRVVLADAEQLVSDALRGRR